VHEAFLFSACAIGLAMLVTLGEKWIYASCAKWVGELTTALDSLFRAGVGEEYLSSLLQASQENATQTRQLKESMVDDLCAPDQSDGSPDPGNAAALGRSRPANRR
jgi:hypothetical protein